jgi:hypothetical protein
MVEWEQKVHDEEVQEKVEMVQWEQKVHDEEGTMRW